MAVDSGFASNIELIFKSNIHREWALTNGIGGYAGSSVIGAHNRTHQGYLIASLHPPVERYLVFSKTDERLICGAEEYDFRTEQYADGTGTGYLLGCRYLKQFDYNGAVYYGYEAGNIKLHKMITLKRGENTSVILYDIENSGPEAKLVITPLMNCREHSESQTVEGLEREFPEGSVTVGRSSKSNASGTLDGKNNAVKMVLRPRTFEARREGVETAFIISRGRAIKRDDIYDINMQLQTEVDNEVPGLDCHFMPYDFEVDIPANSKLSVSCICTVRPKGSNLYEDCSDETGARFIEAQIRYLTGLLGKSLIRGDEFANALTVAADQFIVKRQSTGLETIMAGLPWFTDWGRDTMIAFPGLTLVTGRFEEAQNILKTFARYIHNGLVPNMFPDDGQEPLYNTVDASLWYFQAIYKYLEYTGYTEEAKSFVRTELMPGMRQIIDAYKKGTDFSIYMDKDFLIHAGSGLDQVTWMDVRVGEWVATPRHGKPVEINALWYNALMIMSKLSKELCGDEEAAVSYGELAAKVRASFREQFWFEEGRYLYDVVDGDQKDDSLRPNQIYAISLPFTMLDAKQEQAVVETVRDRLYVGCGLRSLDPSHKDYHPVYLGSLSKRDHAYHQGTAWGFLLGGFITAYVKVFNDVEGALKLLEPVKAHMNENCIGSISEIFDGDEPHIGRGCYAQAWSVGEVLRCYYEDIVRRK